MDLFEQIAALKRDRQAFALATVVARRPPVSAHLGDRALVFADGRIEGFVGGACSQDIIRRQALDAIATRQPRLVSIRPDAGAAVDTAEHVTVRMTCVSEGAIDVYVEPFVQARRLVIVGATPVAEALARLARNMNYDVVRVVDAGELGDVERGAAAAGVAVAGLDALEETLAAATSRGIDQAAVVASQGHYDEAALERILTQRVSYAGLVASKRRGAAVREALARNGSRGLESIRVPAGLDLGARTPAEVALSILAEIIQTAAAAPVGTIAASSEDAVAAASLGDAVDPVCGMAVTIATARHTAEVDGVAYYFCCAACRSRFVSDPQPFLAAS